MTAWAEAFSNSLASSSMLPFRPFLGEMAVSSGFQGNRAQTEYAIAHDVFCILLLLEITNSGNLKLIAEHIFARSHLLNNLFYLIISHTRRGDQHYKRHYLQKFPLHLLNEYL